MLDADDPETCIRREAEEELGYRLRDVRRLYASYMSPGSVTERLWFFVADYRPADRISDGGGSADEGEDIEVIEMTLDEALAMIGSGEIVDAKTIMLVQHLALRPRGETLSRDSIDRFQRFEARRRVRRGGRSRVGAELLRATLRVAAAHDHGWGRRPPSPIRHRRCCRRP